MNDAVRPARIASIDVVRGVVMVLMAIDHVRVFAGVPAGGADPAVFFTRWITHFCAPAFVFFAGTSAYLHGRSHAGLSRFLLLRGAWLVLLELTLVRLAWTFNFDFARYELAGVLWVIGWSMVALAGLSRLPLPLVGAFGVIMIAGHDLLDGPMRTIVPALGHDAGAALWKLLYVGFRAGPIPYGAEGGLYVLYSFVPWVGVMAAGYAFGLVFGLEPARRDRVCLAIGLGATALFLLLRGTNLYGDPQPWTADAGSAEGAPPMPALLSFLNTTKYPASLAFLLMTLGPTIALLPALEHARGAWARVLTVFGRVPFFFYLLHIPLIHLLALLVSRIRLGSVSPWLFANHPMSSGPAPDGYAWPLPLLYGVWAIAIAMLYVNCRWFAGVKARRTSGWLRFI